MSERLDPAIFQKEQQLEFALELSSAVQAFVHAGGVLVSYEAQNSDEAKEGMKRELEGSRPFEAISGVLGESLAWEVTDVSMVGPDSVTKEEYEGAQTQLAESQAALCGLVFGLHDYMYGELIKAFGDEAEADEQAWNAVWVRLKTVVRPMDGTYLAEAADYFDGLIAWAYPDDYDHTDVHRGDVISKDVSARTFYDELEEHLTRSIVRRPDEWSGR